jgi:hypothetical protein
MKKRDDSKRVDRCWDKMHGWRKPIGTIFFATLARRETGHDGVPSGAPSPIAYFKVRTTMSGC